VSGPFSVTSSEHLLGSWVFDVERRTISGPDGCFERDVVVHPGAVAILCVDEYERVALIRQYRATVDALTYEIPAGTLDGEGENALTAAQRELVEEIGVVASSWTELGTFLNSPGWTNQTITIFEARNLAYVPRQPAGPEESVSEVLWLTIGELAELQKVERFFDATTAVALHRLHGGFLG